MTDHEAMIIIRTNRESCVFSTYELAEWIKDDELTFNAAYLRASRMIKRLPVESVGGKFYRLLVIPNEVKDPITKKNVKKPKTDLPSICREILDYLNLQAGTKYKGKPADIIKIKARLAPPESFTVDDFKVVIDKKVKDWKGTEWERYLRPETLFSSKFESYLNEKGSSYKGKADQMSNYNFEKYL